MSRWNVRRLARDKIARYLGVGQTTIEKAEAVIEAAEEEPEEHGYLVDQMDRSGKVAGAFRRLTVLRQAKELDAEPPSLPTGPFQVIVADPPWQYDTGNSLPYPTMPIEDIKALPVQDNCRRQRNSVAVDHECSPANGPSSLSLDFGGQDQ